jgi:hypothetical protein
MYEAGEMCDAVVELAGQTYPVSRIMLSAASTFFHGVFADGMREGSERAVKLDPMLDQTSVELLLRFAHAPVRSHANVDAEEFARAVDQLGFLELLPTGSRLLADTMDVSSCLRRLDFAHRLPHMLDVVLDRGIEIISEHAVELCATSAFTALHKDVLSAILSHDKLSCENEVPLYEGLLSWRAADPARHGEQFDALIELVRLPSLGLEYLVGHVMHANEILASSRVKRLVQEAIAFLTVPAQRAALTSVRTSPRTTMRSEILTASEAKLVTGWLPDRLKCGQLLYRATRDGWSKADFERCVSADHSRTLVVVRTPSNHVFGVYSDVSFGAPRLGTKYTSSPGNAFLFSIRVATDNIPATKFPLLPEGDQHAICCSSAGIGFGGGHDLHIGFDGNTNKASYGRLGFSYLRLKSDGTWITQIEGRHGNLKDDFWTGDDHRQKFLLDDWEVHAVC